MTSDGEYEWLRMPFGLINAGSSFIKAVEMVIRPIKEWTITYVDDMGVGAFNMPQHFQRLKIFFTTLQSAGFTLNLRKSEFAKNEVKFVGHIIGSGHKRPDPDRIAKIKELQRPADKKQLRSVLGLLGYHRDYVQNFAALARPLTLLTAKNAPNILNWGEKEENAFQLIKQKLCTVTLLHIPVIGQPFIIRTDSSGFATGAAIYQLVNPQAQITETGKGEKPIAFFSQKLSPQQTKWSTIEREAFAIWATLRRYHNLIFGSPIVVFCDHNPLSYIVKGVTQSPKLVRWSLALQVYNITFRYVKAAHNKVADFLSRMPDNGAA